MVSRSPLALAILASALSLGAAQAGTPRHFVHAPGDPWERLNRRVFALNQMLDKALIRPLSKLAGGLTPGPVGKAIHNFLVNLNEPVVIVNDLLQARPGPAIRSAFRLVVNSTVGGLGAIDVAKALDVPSHPNGFGDTLGRWGFGPGPYLVVPVLGPSDVRDLFGSVVDDATLPLQSINYPYRTEVDITLTVVGGLDQRNDVAADLDALLNNADDPYATLRSSYLQSREAQIRGPLALPPLPDIEDGPAPAGTAAAPAGPAPVVAPPSAGSSADELPPARPPLAGPTTPPGPADAAPSAFL